MAEKSKIWRNIILFRCQTNPRWRRNPTWRNSSTLHVEGPVVWPSYRAEVRGNTRDIEVGVTADFSPIALCIIARDESKANHERFMNIKRWSFFVAICACQKNSLTVFTWFFQLKMYDKPYLSVKISLEIHTVPDISKLWDCSRQLRSVALPLNSILELPHVGYSFPLGQGSSPRSWSCSLWSCSMWSCSVWQRSILPSSKKLRPAPYVCIQSFFRSESMNKI